MGHAAYQLIHADVGGGIPLKDNSVDAVICSPPYFGLRRYEGVDPTAWPAIRFVPLAGLPPVTVPAMTVCLGLEDTPLAYVGHLVHVFRDVRRVLKDTGVLVCNLGDSYATNPGNGRGGEGANLDKQGGTPHRSSSDKTGFGIPTLNLIGIPWRVAFALQADGYLLRSAPPWIKPDNAMPESVTSRPGTAHEMIFLLAKTSDYYWDADAVRRPTAPATLERDRYTRITNGKDGPYAVRHDHETPSDPAGRNWRTADIFMDSLDEAIATHRGRLAELEAARDRHGLLADADGMPAAHLANPQAFRGNHYAAFSPRLVGPWVKATTPEAGCCAACGRPWRRVVERGELRPLPTSGTYSDRTDDYAIGPMDRGGNHQRLAGSKMCFREKTLLGWSPTCSCPDPGPTRRPLILDCFAGTGSTLIAALAAGRNAVGLDASSDYLTDARRRLERPHAPPRAPVPAARRAGQPTLFGDDA